MANLEANSPITLGRTDSSTLAELGITAAQLDELIQLVFADALAALPDEATLRQLAINLDHGHKQLLPIIWYSPDRAELQIFLENYLQNQTDPQATRAALFKEIVRGMALHIQYEADPEGYRFAQKLFLECPLLVGAALTSVFMIIMAVVYLVQTPDEKTLSLVITALTATLMAVMSYTLSLVINSTLNPYQVGADFATHFVQSDQLGTVPANRLQLPHREESDHDTSHA